MSEPIDHEALALAESLRPKWRPIALGVGINLVLVGLLLGVPYVRGQRIAAAERRGFARLSQCLFGGTEAKAPGFVLPRGDRDHFASQVVYAPSDWPLRCRAPLRSLAPEAAIFLWPAVKRAGADVRAVVKLLDEQLLDLHRARRRGEARVPSRPLDALAKLQAALTLMAEATHVDDGIDEPAVRFDRPPPLAAPARLPLVAGETAQLVLEASPTTLEAFALDGRGISWLRLEEGKLDRERVKRTGLVRMVLAGEPSPLVVWATADARCRERADRCAQRATGVARYDKGAGKLPSPSWLAGHPAGRADRVLGVDADGVVHLLALDDAQGRVALRRFSLAPKPEPSQQASDAPEPPPQAAAESIRIGEAEATNVAAIFLEGSPLRIAYAAVSGDAVVARVVSAADPAAVVALSGVPAAQQGAEAPLLLACASGTTQWLAYGTSRAFRLARVAGDGSVIESPLQATSLSQAIHAEDPALDRMRLSCGEDHALWLALDDRHTLSLAACTKDGACTGARAVASSVAAFAAATTASGVVIAYSGLAPARELRVQRVGVRGVPVAASTLPAACWDPYGGMCGVPTLVTDGRRVVLAARDGEDLLAIESEDGGAHFKTLSGLEVGAAHNPSVHDPMQQHRVRKGLD